jgi:hypothetical protein
MLREAGYEVFDDWYGVGPSADDYWQAYEQCRGRTYREALDGEAAKNTFEFDYRHLKICDGVVMVAPAGKSAHLELGWTVGQGRPGWVLMEAEPERWDVMLQFVFDSGGDICTSEVDLLESLERYFNPEVPF